MIIQDIYDQYHIPPHLQLHMLRVAWVMTLICDNWIGELVSGKDTLIQAALLHDMGNIVKFTFSEDTKDLLEWVNDISALKKIQQSMHEKYWTNDHEANLAICKELGVDQKIIDLVDAVDFNNIIDFDLQTAPWGILMTYADLRVAPFAVVSVKERLDEAARRYKKKKRSEHADRSNALAKKHEDDIFTHCSITPSDINNETVNPLIEGLRKVEIISID